MESVLIGKYGNGLKLTRLLICCLCFEIFIFWGWRREVGVEDVASDFCDKKYFLTVIIMSAVN